MSSIFRLSALAAALALSACGGGGGGSDSPPKLDNGTGSETSLTANMPGRYYFWGSSGSKFNAYAAVDDDGLTSMISTTAAGGAYFGDIKTDAEKSAIEGSGVYFENGLDVTGFLVRYEVPTITYAGLKGTLSSLKLANKISGQATPTVSMRGEEHGAQAVSIIGEWAASSAPYSASASINGASLKASFSSSGSTCTLETPWSSLRIRDSGIGVANATEEKCKDSAGKSTSSIRYIHAYVRGSDADRELKLVVMPATGASKSEHSSYVLTLQPAKAATADDKDSGLYSGTFGGSSAIGLLAGASGNPASLFVMTNNASGAETNNKLMIATGQLNGGQYSAAAKTFTRKSISSIKTPSEMVFEPSLEAAVAASYSVKDERVDSITGAFPGNNLSVVRSVTLESGEQAGSLSGDFCMAQADPALPCMQDAFVRVSDTGISGTIHYTSLGGVQHQSCSIKGEFGADGAGSFKTLKRTQIQCGESLAVYAGAVAAIKIGVGSGSDADAIKQSGEEGSKLVLVLKNETDADARIYVLKRGNPQDKTRFKGVYDKASSSTGSLAYRMLIGEGGKIAMTDLSPASASLYVGSSTVAIDGMDGSLSQYSRDGNEDAGVTRYKQSGQPIKVTAEATSATAFDVSSDLASIDRATFDYRADSSAGSFVGEKEGAFCAGTGLACNPLSNGSRLVVGSRGQITGAAQVYGQYCNIEGSLALPSDAALNVSEVRSLIFACIDGRTIYASGVATTRLVVLADRTEATELSLLVHGANDGDDAFIIRLITEQEPD